MTHQEMLEAALRRPKNYPHLPPSEQWEIDKELGILDWEGPKNAEETRLVYNHHGLKLPLRQ